MTYIATAFDSIFLGGAFRPSRRALWCGSTALNDEGRFMFRVEMQDGAHALVMKIEGQLSGKYAEHARTLVTRCNTELPLIVDLTDVTFVDSGGEEVLSLFGRVGAEFIADNVYSRDLCERLHLPLVRTAVRNRRRNSREKLV